MNDVSLFRLYLLRVMYLVVGMGLVFMIWPLLLNASPSVEHMRGVVWSLLGAVSILAFVGIRYPLQMLPVLIFELVWKSIWVIAIGLPLQAAGELPPAVLETWYDCLISIPLFLIVIPWRYVVENYVRRPGDRWTRSTSALPPERSTQAAHT